MRILKITFSNHRIIGDLELTFMDSSRNPYNVVVLAGENGTGKTAILNAIASIGDRLDDGCIIECKLDERDGQYIIDYENTLQDSQFEEFNNLTPAGVVQSIGEVVLSPSINNWSIMHISYGSPRKELDIRRTRNSTANDIPAIEHFFGNIDVKFKKNDREPTILPVTSTTELSIDSHDGEQDLSSGIKFANELNAAELLVNINSQDANDLQNKVRNDAGSITQDDAEDRIKSFRIAFESFFDNGLTFKGVHYHDVLFSKNGKDFGIVELSSGEKSIVQYGAFFLKNQNVNEPFISLLDEPEQSLHPRWEDRILKYYKDILNKDGGQLSQIFVTTHSEYVIKDAYDANDQIIILSRRDGNRIIANTPIELSPFSSGPTYSEIKY